MFCLVAVKQTSFTKKLEQSFNPEGVFKPKSARFKSLFNNINDQRGNTAKPRRSCGKNDELHKGTKQILKKPTCFDHIVMVAFVGYFHL